MLEHVGIHRVITVDLHASQIQGFLYQPVDKLLAVRLFAEYLENQRLTENPVIDGIISTDGTIRRGIDAW